MYTTTLDKLNTPKNAGSIDALLIIRLFIVVFLIVPSALVSAAIYRVGPGETHTELETVPWEGLNPGDVVEILWRPTPYQSKWVIARSGTATAPIQVRGIVNSNGQRPIITGQGATTRLALDFWNEDRGVIKIGGASVPSGFGRHIVIESLEVRGAYAAYSFTDDRGNAASYRDNAAAIYIEQGEQILIKNCILTDSGNGLFVANQSSNITLDSTFVYGNGNVGSIFEHNSYTEALGMIYQFNRFGPLRDGAGGNNLKDRSAGLVVRYNWIEDGNRQLDLVDSAKFAVEQQQQYRQTVVYGNILIEHDDQGNRQMVHYGGDSGTTANYRKGTLYFYHNTLVSERTGRSTIFRLATNDENADVRNNILFNAGGPNTLELATTAGVYTFKNNWIRENYVASFDSSFNGTITHEQTFTGSEPGFIDRLAQDYRPTVGATVENKSTQIAPALPAEFAPSVEYLVHTDFVERAESEPRDLGALQILSTISTQKVTLLPPIAVVGFVLGLLYVGHRYQKFARL